MKRILFFWALIFTLSQACVLYSQETGSAKITGVVTDFHAGAFAIGIKDNETKSTSLVYPNPTSGIINIDNPSTGCFGYELINITGKTVLSRNDITGTTTKLNMSGLSEGMYIVNVTSEGKSTKHKVVFIDL
jgi:hypothetical protein